MHSAAGMDTGSTLSLERTAITRKKGSNRTASDEARLREIEIEQALWLDSDGKPTVPPSALRTCIETGAKTQRQGAQVRGGLIILDADPLEYDIERYGETLAQLVSTTAYATRVVFQRRAVLRTRAKFDPPWALNFTVDIDPELVDAEMLEHWLAISGRRVGLGDWRPEKSGQFGRFSVEKVEEVEAMPGDKLL